MKITSLILFLLGLLGSCGPSACEKAGGVTQRVNCRSKAVMEYNFMHEYNHLPIMWMVSRVICDEVCVGVRLQRVEEEVQR
jgi:hypothetical protein